MRKKNFYHPSVKKEGQSVSKVEGTSGCDRLRYEEKVDKAIFIYLFTPQS
jgi:hypothetical protein